MPSVALESPAEAAFSNRLDGIRGRFYKVLERRGLLPATFGDRRELVAQEADRQDKAWESFLQAELTLEYS